MKLAIVKLSALGDIVHAMVVLQYIKKNMENVIIDWFVEDRFSEILENNPHINNIYKLKLKNNKLNFFKEYIKLKKISRQNNYDLVIDLQGLIKSAIVAKIISKNVVGFDKNSLRESFASCFYTKSFDIPYEKNVILRNMELICKALDFKMPNLKDKKAFLYSNSIINFKPALLIIVGSSWKSKVYPKEHFIDIVNSLSVDTFIVWGNKEEKLDAEFICKNTTAKILPKLTLNELKSIISNSDLVIGGDSGPTHMAWAQNKPSITIFGPTPSQRNTLKTDINLIIDCKKKIDTNNLDKNNFCIQNINPQEIVKMAKGLLKC